MKKYDFSSFTVSQLEMLRKVFIINIDNLENNTEKAEEYKENVLILKHIDNELELRTLSKKVFISYNRLSFILRAAEQVKNYV